MVHELGKITPKHARTQIQNSVNKYFLKAIKPAKSLGVTADKIKQLKESAGNAVYNIVENKDLLRLTDELDMPVNYRLPTTLKQFNEAIGQMKNRIFSSYDEIAKVADDAGLTIDLSSLYEDKV